MSLQSSFRKRWLGRHDTPKSPHMDTLDRLVKKLENRQLDRSLSSILTKLQGDLIWEIEKSFVCKAYDRNGQVIIECSN